MLQTDVFSDSRFASADYNAIAYNVVVDNREDSFLQAPCVPQSLNGEYKQMMIDDTKAFVLYHKIISKQYTPVAGSSANGETFGRKSGRNIKCTSAMQMILLFIREQIRILPEELEALITTNFPDGSETAFASINTCLTGTNIKPVSSNLDYAALFGQEFRGYDYNLNADRGMLSVTYTIESTFKTKCFSLCDCASGG